VDREVRMGSNPILGANTFPLMNYEGLIIKRVFPKSVLLDMNYCSKCVNNQR